MCLLDTFYWERIELDHHCPLKTMTGCLNFWDEANTYVCYCYSRQQRIVNLRHTESYTLINSSGHYLIFLLGSPGCWTLPIAYNLQKIIHLHDTQGNLVPCRQLNSEQEISISIHSVNAHNSVRRVCINDFSTFVATTDIMSVYCETVNRHWCRRKTILSK